MATSGNDQPGEPELPMTNARRNPVREIRSWVMGDSPLKRILLGDFLTLVEGSQQFPKRSTNCDRLSFVPLSFVI